MRPNVFTKAILWCHSLDINLMKQYKLAYDLFNV